MKIEEVLEIFNSPYTEEIYNRKSDSVCKYLQTRAEGIYYKELKSLLTIFKLLVYDFSQGFFIETKKTIIEILQTAKIGFKKKKAFDDKLQFQDVSNFLNEFIPILESFNDNNYGENIKIINFKSNKEANNHLLEIKFAVIEFLFYFLQKNRNSEFNSSIKVVKKKKNFNKKKLEIWGKHGKNIKECQKIILNQNFNEIDNLDTTCDSQNFENKISYNLWALQNSKIPEAIVNFLQKHYYIDELCIFTLEVINFCSNDLILVDKFCYLGLLKDIIYLIFDEKDNFRSYKVKLCFEILWNSIECLGSEAVNTVCSEDIIFALKELLIDLTIKGYKLEDKCLRNEILILINYILTKPQTVKFLLSDFNNILNIEYSKNVYKLKEIRLNEMNFLEIILYFGTVDETIFENKSRRNQNLRPVFDLTQEDLQFKKLVLSSISYCIESKNEEALNIISNSNFIKALLLYIDAMSDSYAFNRWSNAQLRELQLHSLSILSNVLSNLKDNFIIFEGIGFLTRFLTNTNDSEKKEKCLKVLVVISDFDEDTKKKISDEGLLDVLIDIVNSDNEVLEIRELCFNIISNLCKNCQKNKKQFRNKAGIDIIISALKDPSIGKSERATLYTVSVLDCLWNSVLGSIKNENHFIDNEGFYALMEFIETCEKIHRKISLSCLSQLIENPKALIYFEDWNSINTIRNSTQLLINLYEEEDEKYGVKYENGVLKNYLRPLNPIIENNKGFKKLKEAIKASESDTDAGTEAYLIKKLREKSNKFDLRRIIFSILYRTGFDKNELKSNEKQKIEIIQNYPKLRIGEIYREILKDLLNQNIKPTSEDMHFLLSEIEEFEDLIKNSVGIQTLIAKENKKVHEEELNRFFEIIRNNKNK